MKHIVGVDAGLVWPYFTCEKPFLQFHDFLLIMGRLAPQLSILDRAQWLGWEESKLLVDSKLGLIMFLAQSFSFAFHLAARRDSLDCLANIRFRR